MKTHHLNCGSMCPYGGTLIGARKGQQAEMPCHCLLVETEEGLVLVDTGVGLDDLQHPSRRLGASFVWMMRPRLAPNETALRQVERLGFSADDVRHILVTHLDVDHAGGLGDFPKARLHVFEPEYRAAMTRATRIEQNRYQTQHWAHGPELRTYTADGEHWFGFESVRDLDGLPPEILLIPLVGHSRGHSGIAVDTGNGWLLHCGDAYFHRGDVKEPRTTPPGLRLFQNIMPTDNAARRRNQQRLAQLAKNHGDEVTLFCSHDPEEMRQLG